VTPAQRALRAGTCVRAGAGAETAASPHRDGLTLTPVARADARLRLNKTRPAPASGRPAPWSRSGAPCVGYWTVMCIQVVAAQWTTVGSPAVAGAWTEAHPDMRSPDRSQQALSMVPRNLAAVDLPSTTSARIRKAAVQ
jgi:hypothetical protein